MRNSDMETARRFGVLDKCESLEADLLKIPGVVEVEYDLSGYYDNLHQVIFLTKYDIPVTLPNYYQTRREMLNAIIETALSHGLTPSGDRIEDYGEWFYIVRRAGAEWEPKTA